MRTIHNPSCAPAIISSIAPSSTQSALISAEPATFHNRHHHHTSMDSPVPSISLPEHLDEVPDGDKTEFNKMIEGAVFNPLDPYLLVLRVRALELCRRFNEYQFTGPGTIMERLAGRRKFLKQLFGKTGDQCIIMPPLRVDYGVNVKIGNRFYANYDCVILDCGKVTIGNDVMFGPGVHLYTVEHPLDSGERITGVETTYPITIGDNVWIGGRAVILSGVTIGEGAVVGAGSVVTKDVESFTVVAGNPARFLKKTT